MRGRGGEKGGRDEGRSHQRARSIALSDARMRGGVMNDEASLP